MCVAQLTRHNARHVIINAVAGLSLHLRTRSPVDIHNHNHSHTFGILAFSARQRRRGVCPCPSELPPWQVVDTPRYARRDAWQTPQRGQHCTGRGLKQLESFNNARYWLLEYHDDRWHVEEVAQYGDSEHKQHCYLA